MNQQIEIVIDERLAGQSVACPKAAPALEGICQSMGDKKGLRDFTAGRPLFLRV